MDLYAIFTLYGEIHLNYDQIPKLLVFCVVYNAWFITDRTKPMPYVELPLPLSNNYNNYINT